MISTLLRVSFAIVLLFAIAACGSAPAPAPDTGGDTGGEQQADTGESAPEASSTILTAIQVEGLTDAADAGYWSEAPMLVVETKGSR